ncbi:MAG: gamma-glutamyltransferase [Pseudomonadota bacterium]
MMPFGSGALRGFLRALGAATIVVTLAWPDHLLAESAPVEPIIDYSTRQHAAVDSRGMVAVQNAIAAEVGAAVLAEGGNAVDAAVAVGLALAVTLPRAGNLGGGGFMLIYDAETEETIALDYRERAPAAASRDMFITESGEADDRAARYSYRSVGVPGTVAGMHKALQEHGTPSWAEVIAPAIELARDGIRVSNDLATNLATEREWLGSHPETRRVFYKPDGSSYAPGEILRQPDLAWSLQQLSDEGPDALYRGAVGKRIVADMRANGGLITEQDLADYEVAVRTPVRGDYRGYEIVSMPPPSSGGVLIVQMLNVLEQFDMRGFGFGSAKTIHVMTEAMRTAYADRSEHLGDPDFYAEEFEWLMSKAYARTVADQIDIREARKSSDVAPGVNQSYESPDTTHYAVVDAAGNAVVNTYTLNFSYGSGITARGTGILLNNEMDDFSAKPGSPNGYGLIGAEANEIQPMKRPLSSMTPTLVFKDGRPVLLTGSPGGSKIISTVLQVIVNVIDHEMPVLDAVAAPRFHHQWLPDRLELEPGFSPDTIDLLRAMGHNVYKRGLTQGSAQTISIDDGLFRGAADPRRPDALALGPDGLDCRTSATPCSF